MEGCHCWQQKGMKDGGVPLLTKERHEGWRGATVDKREALKMEGSHC